MHSRKKTLRNIFSLSFLIAFHIFFITNFISYNVFASNSQDSKFVKHFTNGLKLAEKNNFNDAINQFLKAQQIDPSNKDTYQMLAYCYFQTYDTLSAILNYERIIAIDPYDLEIRIYLSSAYMNQKRYDDALKQLDFVLSVQPSNPKALLNLAFLNDYQGNTNEAIKFYEEVLKIIPGDANASFNLGRNYFINDEYDKAIEQFEKALKSNPNDYESIINIGNAYLSMASKLNSELEEQKKNSEKVSTEKSSKLKDLFSKSIPLLEKSLSLNSKNAITYYNLGIAYHSIGEKQKAFQNYNQAIAIDPKMYEAYYNIGCIYATQKDTINAMNFLDKAFFNGFNLFEQLEKDTVWNDYRKTKEFESVVLKYKK